MNEGTGGYTIERDAGCGQDVGSAIKIYRGSRGGIPWYNFRFETYASEGYDRETVRTLEADERVVSVDMREFYEEEENRAVRADTAATGSTGGEGITCYDVGLAHLDRQEYTPCCEAMTAFMTETPADRWSEQLQEQFADFLETEVDPHIGANR